MTQGTEAVREIPRALSQIYYCIDGHEMRGSEGVGSLREDEERGKGRRNMAVASVRSGRKMGACGRRRRRGRL
jgi:hypothetical protein